MIDVTKLVTKEDRPGRDFPTFALKPSEVYPAMAGEITAILADPKLAPAKLLDLGGTPNPLRMYYTDAQKLGPEAFKLALVPRSKATSLPVDKQALRNAALEVCRKWFTELLHQAQKGGPMGVHILAENREFALT